MRDAVSDDEARSELGEIGPLRRGRPLLGRRTRSAERLRLAQQLAQIDALQGAVPQRQAGVARERFFHRAHGRAAGLHVERDAAPTLQKIVVESVFQQRPQRDAAEVRLEREAIGIGVSARSAGELALIQIGRQRLGIDLAARGLYAEVHPLQFHVRCDQSLDLQVALQVERFQR